MKTLPVRWQRLVDDAGATCPRCGATGDAVERAVELLGRALRELGIEVVLTTEALDPAAFAGAPLESNRVWIGGLPLEWWLSAGGGQSQCCSACGDAECRTVTVDGMTYEAIPPELILRAGLLAAARLLQPAPADPGRGTSGPQAPAGTLPSSRCGCG